MVNCTKCKYAVWSFWVANGENCCLVEGCMRDEEPETCGESVDEEESDE